MIFPFHYNEDFRPASLLARVGILYNDIRYAKFLKMAETISIQQVRVAATRLNDIYTTRVLNAMFDIWEYRNFPAYLSRMKSALNDQIHKRAEIHNGKLHAIFVDTDALGDIGDLQAAQHYAYPLRGSLESWRRFFIAAVQGKKGDSRYRSQYEAYTETINKRLEYMAEHGNKAPFWRFIENGNQEYPAFPHNEGMNVLASMQPDYEREMSQAYIRTLQLLNVVILKSPVFLFTGLGVNARVVYYKGKTYAGFDWISRRGNRVFIIGDSYRITRGARPVPQGDGFLLDKFGNVIGGLRRNLFLRK